MLNMMLPICNHRDFPFIVMSADLLVIMFFKPQFNHRIFNQQETNADKVQQNQYVSGMFINKFVSFLAVKM